MDNRENLNALLLQPVNDSIALDKKLADLWVC